MFYCIATLLPAQGIVEAVREGGAGLESRLPSQEDGPDRPGPELLAVVVEQGAVGDLGVGEYAA